MYMTLRHPEIVILTETVFSNKKSEFAWIGSSSGVIQRSFQEECFIRNKDMSQFLLVVAFQILKRTNPVYQLIFSRIEICNSLTTVCLGLFNSGWYPGTRYRPQW